MDIKEYMCKVSTIYLYYYKSYYKLQETSEVLKYEIFVTANILDPIIGAYIFLKNHHLAL